LIENLYKSVDSKSGKKSVEDQVVED